MKKLLCILAGLALASSVNADVRFFFTSSADGAGLSDTTNAFNDTDGAGTDGASYGLSDTAPTVGVPTVDVAKGEFLYLWLAFEGEKNGRTIQGINMVANSEAFGGGVAELDRGMYIGNDDNGDNGGPLRWNYTSKTEDAMTLAGVNVPGIKNATTGWLGKNRVFLLGAINPGDPGANKNYSLALGIGKNGVSYAKNADNQRAPNVKFGSNDEQFDGNVRSEPEYLWSSDADAVVINSIPEPASLLLIALAALGLRRR